MSTLSRFNTVLRYEARLLWRDPAGWLVLALLLTTIAWALHNGSSRVQSHQQAVAAAQAEEQGRIEGLRQQLAAIESGSAAPPAAPFRDPRNALFMGTAAATHATLPLQPLALTAVGQSDLHPATLKVSSASRDSFIFSDEIANPATLLSGPFDLAFVLLFIFPLAILALTYNLISGEREQGTLALTASFPVALATVLTAKLLVRAGLPILVTLMAVAAGVALVAGEGLVGGGAALLTLLLAILLYGAFWAALAAAVNGLGRDSAYNALALTGLWIVLLLIVPALINAIAEARHPSPSRAEMVVAVRAASMDADRARDAALARYQEEHGHLHGEQMARGSYQERTQRRLAVQEAATARAEEILADHDARLQQQRQLANRFAFFSPALLMHGAMAEIAGTGPGRYDTFSLQVQQFHQEWRAFFISRARAGEWLSDADYGVLPRFGFEEERGAGLIDRVAAALAGMGALLLLGVAAAIRSLRRCRVAGE